MPHILDGNMALTKCAAKSRVCLVFALGTDGSSIRRGVGMQHLQPSRFQRSASSVHYFDAISYHIALLSYPEEPEKCVLIQDTKPKYHVCAYNTSLDKYISKVVLDGQAWERPIAEMVLNALDHFSSESNSNAVFLDVGSNIGCHSLYAAACGYHAWAVDALTMNHAKLFKAAELGHVSHLVHQVHNALDNGRHSTTILVEGGNVGGSIIQTETGAYDEGVGQETVSAVLLSDVMEALVEDFQCRMGPLKVVNVVLKMDIEFFECRALLGSARVFRDRRVFIPYVIMEWAYVYEVGVHGEIHYEEACPVDMIKAVTSLFVEAGYRPYKEDTQLLPLNASASHLWENCNVVWVHGDAPLAVLTKPR